MDITYFNRSNKSGISIGQAFRPLINKVAETNKVENYYLPSAKYNLKGILTNLIFAFKRRNKHGINHVTGDCHFLILALIGCKTVLTIHDLGFYVDHKNDMGFLKRQFLYLLQVYLPIKLAGKVIAITNKTRDEINNIVPFKREILVARHHSVDQFSFQPKALDKSHIHFLAVGTGWNKNLETIVKAVSYIPNCTLMVLKKMTDIQKDLCDSLHVHYINKYNVPMLELVQAYADADIVLFPSLYEGLGAITLEAQRTGRPVITTNREPMKSVAGENGAILVDNPKDEKELVRAIKTIIDNDELREQLIKNGYQNSMLYSLDNCAKEHLAIYSSMFN